MKDITVSYSSLRCNEPRTKSKWKLIMELEAHTEGNYAVVTPYKMPFVHHNLYCDSPDVVLACIDIRGHSIHFLIRNNTGERHSMIMTISAQETSAMTNLSCQVIKPSHDEQAMALPISTSGTMDARKPDPQSNITGYLTPARGRD